LSELTEFAGLMNDLMRIVTVRSNGPSSQAELDGRPFAAAAMTMFDGVAVMAGASTIPEGRKQGAQLALLDSRLRYAAEHGYDIAMMDALAGSASQSNAERHGFRIAYTRIEWLLGQPTA
jgi:hypothetical protein